MLPNDKAPVRRRNPRGQGQLLKAQFIEATARLLATLEVPEALTLRQVAREVGVAPASIYSHFPDLSAVVEHVLRQRYAELAELMTSAAEAAAKTGTPGDPLPVLVARCATYVRWGVEQPGHYRTLFGGRMPSDLTPLDAPSEPDDDATHGTGEELLTALVDVLAAVTDPTSAHPPDQHWQAGLLLWSAMHGLISLHNDHHDLPWPALDDLLARLLSLHAARPVGEITALLPSTGR